MPEIKQWWTPVWRGLAVDAAGRHYQKMGNAVWLYLYLLFHADRTTGFLKRKSWTISRDMGIKERTIRKWRGILRRHGYIRTHQAGIYVNFEITKWKGTEGRHKCAAQGDTAVPFRVTRLCRRGRHDRADRMKSIRAEITIILAKNLAVIPVLTIYR